MRALLTATGICAALALALASASFAGQPVTQTLNPPPPPFETCKALGDGTICQGTLASSYGPIDTGLVCGSGPGAFDIFDSASQNEVAMRVYNTVGNLVRRELHDRADGQLSNQLTGTSVPYTQTQTTTDILATPGEFSSATETLTGEIHFRLAGGAPLLIGAGRAVFAPDRTLEFQAGPTGFLDLLAGAPSAVEPICAGLGG
jgi:hypothetical protein